jgi:branched-chain amino acid transport system ATP-binding protein
VIANSLERATARPSAVRDEEPAIHVAGLHKSYDGVVQALDGVDLQVRRGELLALLGPNGAGKTTLVNVISGLQVPTAGRVLVDGDDVSKLKPFKRARRGVARTFQRLEVFGSLSVRENVLVAAELGERRDEASAAVDELLDRIGLTGVAEERVESLPTGLARLVELGRALALGPRLLLLDEPSSGLDQGESEAFGDLLLELAADGLGILLVEHDVELVMRVCHRIFVLDFGQIIAEGTPQEVQRNERVQEAYLGTAAGAA